MTHRSQVDLNGADVSSAHPGAQSIGHVLRAMGIRPRLAVILIPYIWLVLFFLVPFLIVLKISFAQLAIAQPPYSPLLVCSDPAIGSTWQCFVEGKISVHLSTKSYVSIVSEPGQGLLRHALCQGLLELRRHRLLLDDPVPADRYPMAYGIARSSSTVRNLLMMMIILPFWTSFLIRIYAWMGLLKDSGVINNILIWMGVIDTPIPMMNTQFAVYVGIVYSYLPFMILPLYANLEKMDLTLLEAAADLGCKPLKAFFVITVPLSLPASSPARCWSSFRRSANT